MVRILCSLFLFTTTFNFPYYLFNFILEIHKNTYMFQSLNQNIFLAHPYSQTHFCSPLLSPFVDCFPMFLVYASRISSFKSKCSWEHAHTHTLTWASPLANSIRISGKSFYEYIFLKTNFFQYSNLQLRLREHVLKIFNSVLCKSWYSPPPHLHTIPTTSTSTTTLPLWQNFI